MENRLSARLGEIWLSLPVSLAAARGHVRMDRLARHDMGLEDTRAHAWPSSSSPQAGAWALLPPQGDTTLLMALAPSIIPHHCCPFLCPRRGYGAAQCEGNGSRINYESWNLTNFDCSHDFDQNMHPCAHMTLPSAFSFRSFFSVELPAPRCASWQGCSFHSG